jgi:hypothetical protein
MNAILIGLFVVLMALIGPAIMLWAINTLAAAGGSGFYIKHGFWTYVACLALMSILGSSASAKK